MTPTHFPQEMYIHDLNFEFGKLGSTEDVDSAQAATAPLHKDWLDIKSVDVRAQKGVSNLFSSKEKLENEKRMKAREAFEKYHKQGNPKKRNIYHQNRPNPDL